MLKKEQIQEFRELLSEAQNPVFFFDNDVDGLASFLLLRRFCGKGKGVAIKSFPDLNPSYARKLHEFKPDYIFILDKPVVAQSFIEEAKQLNINVVWLDHHPINHIDDYVKYFNPLQNEPKNNEPVSYWCYKISGKKEDQWISMLGCLADWFLPDFAEDFSKENKTLFSSTENPAKALYETELGKIAKVLSFALKDRTSNVVQMLKVLVEVKDVRELLEETGKTSGIFRRFKQIDRKYNKLLEKAIKIGKEVEKKNKKLLFFQYGGQLSLSGELANEIYYNFPKLVIVVAYIKGAKVNCSIRGRIDVRSKVAEAMQGIEGTHGGHENACGASMQIEDLIKFRENLINLLK